MPLSEPRDSGAIRSHRGRHVRGDFIVSAGQPEKDGSKHKTMTFDQVITWIIGLVVAFGGGGVLVALIDRKNKKDQILADAKQRELDRAAMEEAKEKEIQAAREEAANEQLKRMGDVALLLVEPLSIRVRALEEERAGLKKRIDALENEVGCLKDSVDAKDKEIIQLRELITQRDTEIGKLRSDVKDRDAEIANLRGRIEELEKGVRHD